MRTILVLTALAALGAACAPEGEEDTPGVDDIPMLTTTTEQANDPSDSGPSTTSV